MTKPRKRFFANLISDKIIELINAEPQLDRISTVSKGDLSTLPSDEAFDNKEFSNRFFPAIYICPTEIYNTTVNGNKSISATEYYFVIRYLRYFDGDNEYANVLEEAFKDAELIGDVLLGDTDLGITQVRLYEDVVSGTDTIKFRKPFTLNPNDVIKIGLETARIVSTDESNAEFVSVVLNTSLTQNYSSNTDIAYRNVNPNAPQYVELIDAEGNAIGQILRTEVPKIGIDTIEQEMFYMGRKLPVVIINIEYNVTFRSYYVR
jgi:hypothetical protein